MDISYQPPDDILNSSCQIVCIPVNAVGVMGAGLARHFVTRYPLMFGHYREHCMSGNYRAGDILVTKLFSEYVFSEFNKKRGLKLTDPIQRIAFIATKQDWRNKSELAWVVSGLRKLKEYVLKEKVESVALPPLGCGLGGLSWKLVHASILETFQDTDIKIIIYGAGRPPA